MGRNGRAYVKRNYRWDVIISKYERMFAKLRARQAATSDQLPAYGLRLFCGAFGNAAIPH
jgi:hypothetical protein